MTVETNSRNSKEVSLKQPQTVLAPTGSFESPAPEFVPGPYYASAEEKMPELESDHKDFAGDKKDPTGKAFPVGRRDFMKLFSIGALAGASSCVRRPTETAIPHVNQPIDHIPGE